MIKVYDLNRSVKSFLKSVATTNSLDSGSGCVTLVRGDNMKGARSLTDEEISLIFNTLKSQRDKALWILGCKSGLRISELLSLKIKDVMEHGQVGSQVTVAKKNTKGKIESKTLPLTNSAKVALGEYLGSLRVVDPNDFLFRSTQSRGPISRIQAHRILKNAFNTLQLKGKCSTHSMRKSYCYRVHKALGSKIEKTQVAMGHKNISSTVSYLAVDREEVEKAILGLG